MTTATTRTWVQQGTQALLHAVDRLPDDELDRPTALPCWSRRHLVAHLGFNAEALRRLAAWARTGVPSPMYASAEQRTAEIAEGATWDAARLRAFLTQTASALEADLDALTDDQWAREVVTAQGRHVPATEIPWMRTREVTVHAVDLDAGVGFADLPSDLCAALVADVAALRSKRADGPALHLVSTEGGSWDVTGEGEPVRVHAPVSALARWLTGRGPDDVAAASAMTVPRIGPWL